MQLAQALSRWKEEGGLAPVHAGQKSGEALAYEFGQPAQNIETGAQPEFLCEGRQAEAMGAEDVVALAPLQRFDGPGT